MTVYNVITKKEIEDRIETNNTLRAGNIFRITNGDQYILKHDGTIEIHRPQSHTSYSHRAQNTRKHSNPHIKESLANLRLSHKSKRNTINAMQSLGMLSITPNPINKHRKQKSTKQLSLSSMKYNRYPNYLQKQKTRNYRRL
jgi:hypothetical protein